MMEAARLFNPGKVTDFKPTAVTVDSLKAFPFSESELGSLLSSLPSSSRWHIDPLMDLARLSIICISCFEDE